MPGLLMAAAGGFGLAWSVGRVPLAQSAPMFSRVTRLIATDANETAPVLSPDGKWIAYIADAGGRIDVWVRFLSGGRTVNLTGGDREIFVAARRDIGGLDISPDGTQITFDGGLVSSPANSLRT